MVTEILWGDGTGDKIYLTYTAASGNQTIMVSSDANAGPARTKDITFTSGVGSITAVLSVTQKKADSLVSITWNDTCITYNDTAIGYKLYDSEIEYLRSSGTQYIELPLSCQSGTYFEISGTLKAVTSSRSYMILGADPNAQFHAEWYSRTAATGMHTYASTLGGVATNGGISISENELTYFLLSTTKKITGGVETETIRPLKSNITSFKLFGGYTTYNAPIIIGSLSIVVGDNLVYDLIPVRVGQVGYMYDKISGTLYGNNGTGDFILGPDK
jgi:hypothetical protein